MTGPDGWGHDLSEARAGLGLEPAQARSIADDSLAEAAEAGCRRSPPAA